MGGSVKKAVNAVFVDPIKKAVNVVAKVTKSVISNTIGIITPQLAKTINKYIVDFPTKIINNVLDIVATGSWKDVAGLALSFLAGGVAGVIAYAVVRVAIPAVTAAAADMGWISQETAAMLNIVASAVFIMYTAFSGNVFGVEYAGALNTPTVAGWLESMGVSSATAISTVEAFRQIGAYASIGYQVYGIYESVQAVQTLKEGYAKALADFEAWKADFERARAVSEGSHQEAMDFATGQYYKKLPGQDLYHIFMPGREAYVCMEAVAPAYWVENRQSPFTTEREIVSMTWDQWLPLEDRFDLKGF